ncbi:alpha/beta fold hydrolase [Streptomyces sp. NPDC056231]|uniref:alpha/beta fold hydrolase n=1 Tax=Streptomyces sp. NPDC056231 TaxID=3345755 RepID=UPI003AABF883
MTSISRDVQATSSAATWCSSGGLWTGGHPLGDAPSAVTVPTLLITSDDTFASRPLVREQVASRFEHCETAYVPGAGHWPHVEQPAAVARILTDYVNSIANT